MGVKLQSTDTYKQKVFAKRGDKVEILSEYLGGTEPIDFVYHCEKHGDTYKTLNAKNVTASCFQPCKQCDLELKSQKAKVAIKDKGYQYRRLQEYCRSMGGELISTEWTIAKDLYEVDCKVDGHPNFFSNADSLLNKPQWCPACYGRTGEFQKEMEDIVNSKNGTLLGTYEGAGIHLSVTCNEHNYTWDIMPLNLRKGRWCPICNLPYSEKVPYDYLVDTYPNYNIRVQYTFDDLMGENGEHLKYDFGILDDDNNKLLGLVEIDDEEHRYNHTQPRRVRARERDHIKDKYCEDNNIPLFRLEYYNGKDIFKDRDWYYNYIHKNLNEFLNSIIKK